MGKNCIIGQWYLETCPICGELVELCLCPACHVCGQVGKPICLQIHEYGKQIESSYLLEIEGVPR